MFRHFADREFRGSSPRYDRLARLLADRPELAVPLLAAPRTQQRAILYFAAVQYLLRTTAVDHPLAAYLPVLGGDRGLDDGFEGAFEDLVTAYAGALERLCATRHTQTNEARRAALLRPGFGRASELLDDHPLSLVELGTSAGLLLLPDRYGYRYATPDGTRVLETGRADAPTALVMRAEVRGTGWPSPAGHEFIVARRVGIDTSPSSEDVDWLRSCIWPEHTERLVRLDAALAEAAVVQPELVAGDMVESLPAVLSTMDDEAVPCVFASNAINYLTRDGTARLVEVLASWGARRDLVVVLNEASRFGAELFLPEPPVEAGPPGVLVVGLLTLVAWREGRATVEVLARTGPHGEWLEWLPHEYRYAPSHSRSTG